MKTKRSIEEEAVFANLKANVYIALGGMVVPSLRCIGINWTFEQTVAKLMFFHDGPVLEPNRWHYSCIEAEATSFENPLYKNKEIRMQMGDVISCISPKELSAVSEIVYLRNEPNLNFHDVNQYVPNWGFNSIIRLKVNEALRGKVTGALRAIHLNNHESHNEVAITFFHNGDITNEIGKHYEEIFNIATKTASSWKKDEVKSHLKFAIKTVLYPEKITYSKGTQILYSRKEPFTDNPVGDD